MVAMIAYMAVEPGVDRRIRKASLGRRTAERSCSQVSPNPADAGMDRTLSIFSFVAEIPQLTLGSGHQHQSAVLMILFAQSCTFLHGTG